MNDRVRPMFDHVRRYFYSNDLVTNGPWARERKFTNLERPKNREKLMNFGSRGS